MAIKKHISQMTELEEDFLMRQFRKVGKDEWTFNPYSFNRLQNRRIAVQQYELIFKQPKLIEYSRNKGEDRILLRGGRVGEYEVCVVFSLTKKEVVTVWLNWFCNRHYNLDEKQYSNGRTVNIKKTFGGEVVWN